MAKAHIESLWPKLLAKAHGKALDKSIWIQLVATSD